MEFVSILRTDQAKCVRILKNICQNFAKICKKVCKKTPYKSYDGYRISQHKGWDRWGLSVSFTVKGIESIV